MAALQAVALRHSRGEPIAEGADGADVHWQRFTSSHGDMTNLRRPY
jgi:hypothetical protein